MDRMLGEEYYEQEEELDPEELARAPAEEPKSAPGRRPRLGPAPVSARGRLFESSIWTDGHGPREI